VAVSVPRDDENGDGIVAEINITPLTDVFLVLLIIFMVTSSVIATQGKPVNLPEAAKAATSTPQAVSVTVTAGGEIQVNDQIVTMETLPKVLKQAIEDAREKVVILRGDRTILLGQAVTILDLADQYGAKISIATKPPPKS
jgi:biopolymer transport protein ExbD